MSELWELGAFELGAAIRDRAATSREAVEAHLGRIDDVNPAVNAVSAALADEALAAADEADAAIARDEHTSPVHGVPFTVKETIDLAGSPTTQGVAALAEVVPPLDAPAVANLRAAGAIPFARTVAPDLPCAGTPTTRCTARPATRGTPPGPRADRAAVRRRRWRRG
jgi:amidase